MKRGLGLVVERRKRDDGWRGWRKRATGLIRTVERTAPPVAKAPPDGLCLCEACPASLSCMAYLGGDTNLVDVARVDA